MEPSDSYTSDRAMASAGEATTNAGGTGGEGSSGTSSRGRDNRGRGRGRGGGGRSRGGRGDSNARGGGSHRGRGRGNSGAESSSKPQAGGVALKTLDLKAKTTTDANGNSNSEGDGLGENDEGDVCFICANPVSHSSIAPCNHITCHICALRMRALYKNKDCPHCRTAAPYVIFTDDASKRFDEYTDADITSRDDNIGIRYTSEDIVGDTILLLRYNCPDSSCDFAGMGWPDLHRHVRSAHNKRMCDLCTRNKKVFTHEHDLFTDKGVGEHMRHGDDKPGAVDQTGFKGHPLCDFCGERFYDGDKLYEHCRHKHERCFVCDRRDSRRPHYYRDYNALEKHFREDHFLCMDGECLEKKFVVFESELDLKAHQLSEHGNKLSKDVRRDARVVDMSSFDFRPSYQQMRGGGGGGGSGSGAGGSTREGRGRGRDPNSEPVPMSSAQPMRRDEIAFQRQMAIHSAQSISNRTFGGQLTSSSSPSNAAAAGANSRSRQQPQQAPSSSSAPLPSDEMTMLSITDPANLTPQDHARLARHGAVIERAGNLLGNDAANMAMFRSHISSYRQGKLSPPQLVDAFFTLFSDTSSDALGTLVREVADLYEDKTKGEALRKAWQDWRAINEDYPSLPGLGGMHGATTSSSGWANAVLSSPSHPSAGSGTSAQQQKHTTRVLKLKNSTRRGSTSSAGSSAPSISGPSGNPVPGAIWVTGGPLPPTTTPSGRVPATSSSAAFPALPSASGGSSSRPTPQPMWIGGTAPIPGGGGGKNGGSSQVRTAASRAAGTTMSSSSSGAGRGGGSRPGASEDNFPALPTAPKPMTTIFGYGTGAVRRDLGNNRGTGFSWGGGGGGSASGSSSAAQTGEQADADSGGQGGKKKKQGKKQVLVQWG